MVCLYQKDPRSEQSGGRRRTGDGDAVGVNLTIGFHIMKVSRRGEGGERVGRGRVVGFCLLRTELTTTELQ